VEYQNVNLNGGAPSGWMAHIYTFFHDEVAHGMERREESLEYGKSGN